MTSTRKRPPTVAQLLRLLNRVRVKTVRKFADPNRHGEWRPDEADGDLEGAIVVAVGVDRSRGMDGAVSIGLHELTHAFFQVNCQDNRVNHDRVYRWEGALFKSRALREAMAIRIANAYIYRQEEP